jgi:hypothetical protein
MIIPMVGFSQNESKQGLYKNEFGIDATSFILRFLKFEFSEDQYIQTYYLTYRRLFEKGNLRSGIGGFIENKDLRSAFAEDINKYNYESFNLNFRIGWEWKNEFSKRWQVFYGCDFRPSYFHIKDDAPFWNGGYANGYEQEVTNFGIAPLIGFRFRLNDRLSLSTETSLSFNYQSENLMYFYTPVTSDFPPKKDIKTDPVTRVFTSFGQPLMIFLTFDM